MASDQFIVALDQGTTSSRAIIFNKKSEIVNSEQLEFHQLFPEPGWVEHDPLEIWHSQLGVLKKVLKQSGVEPRQIAGIGITNQRETTIVWDRKTGEPVYNAIVWQCRRTADICQQLRAEGHSALVQQRTGLVLDAYFSGSKVKWILDNVPGVRAKAERGDLAFGTVDSWLIWHLTGGEVHVTDMTNASRTMLFNIHQCCWDQEMLKLLDIPESMLPEVRSCSEVFGKTRLPGFEGIPIAGIAGDQQAALFGQLCTKAGMAKNTYGTGCFTLMNTGTKAVASNNGLLTTIACARNGEVQYALEGSVFMAGATVQWLRDQLGLIQHASETEFLATQVNDNNGVYLVPAFVGLGAPYWDQNARGVITGLTRGASRNHIVRAALESIAYQSRDVLDAMRKDAGLALTELRVDGGAVANNFLMQFQADMIDCKVIRPKQIESTALGAAYLAGLAVGFWESTEELSRYCMIDHQFEPELASEQRDRLYQGWQAAVARTRSTRE